MIEMNKHINQETNDLMNNTEGNEQNERMANINSTNTQLINIK